MKVLKYIKKLVVDLDYLRDTNLYDQIARDIYSKISTDKINALETKLGLDYCYWISGKGIVGCIASEVAIIIRKEDSEFKRNNNLYTILIYHIILKLIAASELSFTW